MLSVNDLRSLRAIAVDWGLVIGDWVINFPFFPFFPSPQSPVFSPQSPIMK
ncbi:MAG: hypothetical protein ACKO9I_04285 [Sphaerospermopsis kisseleviana]|uniref:Uncharacterized protein n=2 Tax=Sphaerospermopsis TaxID=752201 RepID=A0ABR9VL75_9CYAN|nr:MULTISPECIES: hypothetical protein [Sphaerospermopsis]MBD2135900.1 hypothetical protein [Sphaerospermopsis sp. FACHB-1094]MBD2148384.1 hypothetical protein [Sphaerospermopsis sp. FACHB-1194]MBE9239254.1 hypothetical protein [Sphaerospermopsis aphanizomenoides LEGE 00250]MDB9441906.1 hypothetical protein [Sphaerospermopsis kisseleviana CS-549]